MNHEQIVGVLGPRPFASDVYKDFLANEHVRSPVSFIAFRPRSCVQRLLWCLVQKELTKSPEFSAEKATKDKADKADKDQKDVTAAAANEAPVVAAADAAPQAAAATSASPTAPSETNSHSGPKAGI